MFNFALKKKIHKIYSLLFICIILLAIYVFNFSNKNSYSDISLVSTVEPYLFTVCIDAGHGDWDLGASGIYSDEKTINLNIALKLGALLEENEDIRVIYTRTTDNIIETTAFDSLCSRVNFSNANDSDLFISLHCNSYPDDIYVDGVETWYNPADSNSKYFASLVQNELVNLNYTSDRGIITYTSDDSLYVIENTYATSILIELGFISNPYDEEFLSSNSGQNLCAEAIYNAILNYIDYL